MVRLFGDGRFLDAEIEGWVLETWAWLLKASSGWEQMKSTRLVLPTRDFYPPTQTTGHDRALYVFELTRRFMFLDDWPVELEAFERLPRHQRVGTYAALQRGESASGTFRVEDGRAIITYATDLVDDPRRLIATLSHELAHYRLATILQPIPGGNDLHELATELTVAFCGFGVFGANAAFSFEQHHDTWGRGWSAQRSGYFSERTWAFALALFLAMTETEIPQDHLKRSVADLTRQAQRYLKRHDTLLEPLRAVAG
jgi:hypothetical protein